MTAKLIIGVVGAGTMGNGIAQVAAAAGHDVIMRDITDEFVQRGLKNIAGNLGRDVKKNRLSQEQADSILGRVQGTTALGDLAPCNFVIEAIIERMDLKKELYRELDGICQPGAVFASNTSGLSVTEMAAATARPNKFIGMHFFNPDRKSVV